MSLIYCDELNTYPTKNTQKAGPLSQRPTPR